MPPVYLISCTRTKRSVPGPARDLYRSRWFQKAVAVAERQARAWYIVSAEHGLVEPERILAPYDQNLTDLSEPDIRHWATRIAETLAQRTQSGDEVVILGENSYSAPLRSPLEAAGLRVKEPFRYRNKEERASWLDEMLQFGRRSADLDQAYDLLGRLQAATPFCKLKDVAANALPSRGVYFFFEEGETRIASRTLRVTRIGTHAVSAGSRATIWQRLRTHRGGADFRGNHRSSVFRLHVGAALMRAGLHPYIESWGVGGTAPTGVQDAEAPIEHLVSTYIGQLRVACLEVTDAPGKHSDRAYLERHLIALVTCGSGPVDPPTSTWLGHDSPQRRICTSGLWNLNYVGHSYDPNVLHVLEQYVLAAEGRGACPDTPLAPTGWLAAVKRPDQLDIF
jgi:hypothetical protein